MRFLCNENVPRALVEALTVLGHDVKWGRKERPGIDDREVLQRSIAENRVCITFDKDFGELVEQSQASYYCVYLLPLGTPKQRKSLE
jgi:predicted nuclease of predicted toxin-antitoxin system